MKWCGDVEKKVQLSQPTESYRVAARGTLRS